MSGVWVFKDGVVRDVDKPAEASASVRNKVLVHLPTSEVISSYASLERKLEALGWKRFYKTPDPDLIQFGKEGSIQLISLPMEFSSFKAVHMYAIVQQNPDIFEVRSV